MATIKEILGSEKIKDSYDKIFDSDDAINTELEEHLASLIAHANNGISNVSGVTGAKTSDALDTLKTVVDNINASDSNADIGVYTLNDTTNTNDYVGDLGQATLFGGMNLILYIENPNTGSATLDIGDGNGAKAIKSITGGVKRNVYLKELSNYNLLKYDGTDWILQTSDYENVIVDETNNKVYRTQEKLIDGKPVLEYEEV